MSYIKRWLESLSNDPEAVRRALLAGGEPYVSLRALRDPHPDEEPHDFDDPGPAPARDAVAELNELFFD